MRVHTVVVIVYAFFFTCTSLLSSPGIDSIIAKNGKNSVVFNAILGTVASA